jgi:hypothetical protein
MASRMQVATYIAEHLTSDRKSAVRSAAAWLTNAGHSRQAGYLARDVAAILASRGHVLAEVTSARPLNDAARKSIEIYIKSATGASELELETSVDASLIGGLKIELPGATLDASVRTKLDKFVEGANL